MHFIYSPFLIPVVAIGGVFARLIITSVANAARQVIDG